MLKKTPKPSGNAPTKYIARYMRKADILEALKNPAVTIKQMKANTINPTVTAVVLNDSFSSAQPCLTIVASYPRGTKARFTTSLKF